jgi:hypothetical protein
MDARKTEGNKLAYGQANLINPKFTFGLRLTLEAKAPKSLYAATKSQPKTIF